MTNLEETVSHFLTSRALEEWSMEGRLMNNPIVQLRITQLKTEEIKFPPTRQSNFSWGDYMETFVQDLQQHEIIEWNPKKEANYPDTSDDHHTGTDVASTSSLDITLKTLMCNKCQKTFTRRLFLLKHVKICQGPKPQCPKCKKTYIKNACYLKHIDQCNRILQCTKCEKLFDRKDYFVKHQKICGIDLQCTVYDNKFKSITCLTNHRAIQFPLGSK